MQWLRSLLKNSHGSAGAEMALVLPMLFALLFTTFEGGNYLWSEHKVVKGVRDGARYAGRLSFSSFDCTNGTISDADAMAKVKLLTRTGTLDSTANPTVSGWADDDITITVNCLAPDETDPDDLASNGIYVSNESGAPRVSVSANVEYPSLFSVLGFDTSSARLKSVAQSAVMGI